MKRIVCFHSDVDFGVTTHLDVTTTLVGGGALCLLRFGLHNGSATSAAALSALFAMAVRVIFNEIVVKAYLPFALNLVLLPVVVGNGTVCSALPCI